MGGSDLLAPALLKVLERVGEGGLKLSVSVRDDEEVKALRDKVAELEALTEGLRAEYNRLEFQFRCETLINAQITDFCRVEGVKLPRRLFKRPGQS